jgi:hypothetical protein
MGGMWARRLSAMAVILAGAALWTAAASTAAPATTTTTTTSTTECTIPPAVAWVDSVTVSPGETVHLQAGVLSAGGTVPNPNPALCPLPVPWDGQIEMVLHLAPPETAAAAATVDLGSFASVDGVVQAALVIPPDLAYRGLAVIELVGDLDSLPQHGHLHRRSVPDLESGRARRR